jgi:hypothetical protein
MQPQSKKQAPNGAPFSRDIYIVRWSNVLSVLVILAALLTIILIINFTFYDGKIGLLHDKKVYVFFIKNLSWPEFYTTIMCIFSVELTWMLGLLQLFRLARHFRHGRIFDEDNSRHLMRISYVLVAVTIIDALTPPIISAIFYWRGVTPWMSDIPMLELIEPAYVLAAIFFFILAKVMSRAADMERESRLYV